MTRSASASTVALFPAERQRTVYLHLWWRIKTVPGWADRRLNAFLFSFSCLSGEVCGSVAECAGAGNFSPTVAGSGTPARCDSPSPKILAKSGIGEAEQGQGGPATIMMDPEVADRTYLESLTAGFLTAIQFAVDPRTNRTVPVTSKTTGMPLGR